MKHSNEREGFSLWEENGARIFMNRFFRHVLQHDRYTLFAFNVRSPALRRWKALKPFVLLQLWCLSEGTPYELEAIHVKSKNTPWCILQDGYLIPTCDLIQVQSHVLESTDHRSPGAGSFGKRRRRHTWRQITANRGIGSPLTLMRTWYALAPSNLWTNPLADQDNFLWIFSKQRSVNLYTVHELKNGAM